MGNYRLQNKGILSLCGQLLTKGYSDVTVSEMNRTLTIRLLVTLSKPLGWLLPFKNSSATFFFFPFFHVGGAERVHADIIACMSDRKPWVIFTKKSANSAFRSLFSRGARLLNLWPFCKYLYPVSVGIMAGFINKHSNPVVFGANSLFFSLLVPSIKPESRCIDLIHAFGGGVEDFTIYAAPRLDARVVINHKTREDLTTQYLLSGINPTLAERIVLIGNATRVPEHCPDKSSGSSLTVVYVGRGSQEKRVHLFGAVARLCKERGVAATFLLVGNVIDSVYPADREFCEFVGEVTVASELESLYRTAHILIISSSREGFPMTVMEGMANGVVPLCTAVGGIPEHVHHEQNGLLIESLAENEIVESLAAAVALLSQDRKMLTRLSHAAHSYARDFFSEEKFCEAYRRLIGNA
jgi:glycosyltransferase involved in cell wall biosynthesis